MIPSTRPHQLHLFVPPYRLLIPVPGPESLSRLEAARGAAVVWCMGSTPDPRWIRDLRARPGGMPLLVVLPRANEVDHPQDLFSLVDQCRPHSLLPFHDAPEPTDLRTLLASVPMDLAGALVEYVGWRGLVLDLDLRRTIRRILELSAEVRTVSGLARGLYMSRRALGRRFLREGLPVPSHWLHFGRVVRVSLELQKPGVTLMEAAFGHGYPDGFSLSNQMKRLTGLRPTDVAPTLGWEWIAERWIQEEVRTGGFRADHARVLARCLGSSSPLNPVGQDERQPA